jgi:hypothetical protein
MDDIKTILKAGLRFGAVGRVPSKKIDEAAEVLLQCSTITRDGLEGIGKGIAGDNLLFINVDVEKLNRALERRRKVAIQKQEVKEQGHSQPLLRA